MKRLGPILANVNTTTTLDNKHKNTYLDTPKQSTRPRPHPPPPRSLRAPLQPRDHNAMMRMPPKSPLQGGNGNHNHQSSNMSNKNPSKPLLPTLSAAAQKASNRTPFTPRVAGSVPARESTPTQPPRPRSQQNKTPGGGRDEVLSPVSTFLSHNVTPRSGSRKIRVDSTNTTPTSTPNATSPGPPQYGGNEGFRIAQDSTYTGGLGIGGVDRDVPKRQTVSFSPSVSDVGSTRGSVVQQKPADSKFFFASDAKTVQTQTSRPPLVQQKTSTFLYANGDTIPPPLQSSNTSAVGSAVGEERSQPKFFHANGTPDLQASPSPHFAPPRASSTVSSSSRITSPRLANSNTTTNILSPTPRPASPSKLSQNSSVSSSRSAVLLPSPALSRPPIVARGQSVNGVVAARRASIEDKKTAGHARTTSISSANGDVARKASSGSIAEIITPTTPLNLATTSLTMSTPEEMLTSPLELPSPKKSNPIEKMNELAANARRERKVLDLEITNSSLAAINRTLEREMRKQTAELRRYRRLSRSGRLSIATSASMRTSIGTLDGEGGLSDMSEEEESEEESEIESDSSSSMEGSLSPDAVAESDLRHRQKDEQRLQIDLSKHQQLLVDSQKMNESLKRCLGWTEELISEGKKALAYRVRVDDVALGGRVLVEDDAEELDENEGMSDIGGRFLKEAREKAAAGKIANGEGSPWLMPREDRDSGIEVDEVGIELS